METLGRSCKSVIFLRDANTTSASNYRTVSRGAIEVRPEVVFSWESGTYCSLSYTAYQNPI